MTPFEDFHQRGFTSLVPIIPPDAEISEGSSLYKRIGTPQDGRGKTPGIKGRNGRWFSFDWVPYQADEADLVRWGAMQAGVGIKTGAGLVAIDADTLDADSAATIRDAVDAAFDRPPVRVGNYPKALYLVRVSGEFQYQRIEFGPRDAKNRLLDRVEILSDGRQFVAHGTHPKTGQPYAWPRGLPVFDDLPIASPQQLTELLDTLRPLLPSASERIIEGATTEVNQHALKGDLETIRQAVRATPNTSEHFPSRESYRDFGYAIKAALPDDEPAAFEIFADWCERWDDPAGNDIDVVHADWRRMKPPFRRGAGWIYDMAERLSDGQFSQAQVWFEDVMPADNPFAAMQEPAPADTYPVLTLDQIVNRAPPVWIIDRTIPERSFGFLYARPRAGKTFIALDMALSIADGRTSWHGDEIRVPPGAAVLYLAAEGSFGFRNRIKAWCETNGASDMLASRFRMIERTINFMDQDDIAKLVRTVRTVQAEGLPLALVVVDTVSRALPGADENLQKDMTLFVRACDVLKDVTGGAVLGVHHTNKEGGIRGSSVLLGAGDFVLRLERAEGHEVGQLHCEKQKDGPDGWADSYAFASVDLGEWDGRAQTSLTVSRLDVSIGGQGVEGVSVTPSTAGAVLRAMQAAWEAGEPWSHAPQAKDRYAVRLMVADFGFKADAAESLVKMWLGAGIVENRVRDGRAKQKGLFVLHVSESPAAGVFD